MRKPKMNPEFFRARRSRLAQLIPNCALILPAWPEYYRNADSEHGYRPESNLYYLTGFEEPESCLVFRPGKTPETIMFVREKNVERETWTGFRYGVEGAKSAYGFDATYPISEFENMCSDLLRGCERVYYTLYRNRDFDEKFSRVMMGISGWRPKLGVGLPSVEDAYSVVSELRIRKTEEEADQMRKAGNISAEAHVAMMKATKPGINERALHGVFLKEIRDRGADAESYGGIVATGDNATTLHYRFNDADTKDGDLLLVDCGAEYGYYAGDITRTYPVNGKFSPTQKRMYAHLLKLQKDLINMVKPGELHANLQKHTIQSVCEFLAAEKILPGTAEEIRKAGTYARYYPHGVSHLLGLDVHDAGALVSRGQPRAMEPGWVITIEPGLYFPANDTTIPAEWRGLGIRIEDDVMVTPDGNEVFTKAVPKEIEEIEALVGHA